MAGREAEIVGILPKALPDGTISEDLAERTPDAIARKVEWVREAAGARFDTVELSMMVSRTLPTITIVRRRCTPPRERGGASPAERVLEMPGALVGPVSRIVDDMLARRGRYGFSYYVVSDRDLESFSPVVGRLAGC
jgi:hypothetical protein